MAATKAQVERIRKQLNSFQDEVNNTVTACRNRMDEESCTDAELASIDENINTWTNQLKQQRERTQKQGQGYR
jgi:septal ring factor EnvC (AmiA/AmiB activator)